MKSEREDRQKTFRQMVDKSKSVVADEMTFTTTPGFFDNKSKEDIKNWADTCMEFVYKDLGYTKEQVLHATVHMDEKTPHIHCVVISLVKKIDKRTNTERYTISKKQYIHDKNHLSELQDKYCLRLNRAGFELERGKKHSESEHLGMKEFKRLTKDVNKEITKKEEKLDIAINDLEEKMQSNKSIMFDKESVKIKKDTFDSMNKVIDEAKELKEYKPKLDGALQSMKAHIKDYTKVKEENKIILSENKKLDNKIKELKEEKEDLEIENINLRTKVNILEQTVNFFKSGIEKVTKFISNLIEDGYVPRSREQKLRDLLGPAYDKIMKSKEKSKYDDLSL